MTIEEVHMMAAKPGEAVLLAKKVIGLYDTVVSKNDKLREALQFMCDALDAKNEEYEKLRAEFDEYRRTHPDVPPIEPPPDQAEAKALSPPRQVPQLNQHQRDTSFFKVEGYITLETCENKLKAILFSSKTKAAACRKLHEEEDRYFYLGKCTNEEKANLINQYITPGVKFGKFNKNDFSHYWKD